MLVLVLVLVLVLARALAVVRLLAPGEADPAAAPFPRALPAFFPPPGAAVEL